MPIASVSNLQVGILFYMARLQILSLLSAGLFVSEVMVVLMPTQFPQSNGCPRRNYARESVFV